MAVNKHVPNTEEATHDSDMDPNEMTPGFTPEEIRRRSLQQQSDNETSDTESRIPR